MKYGYYFLLVALLTGVSLRAEQEWEDLFEQMPDEQEFLFEADAGETMDLGTRAVYPLDEAVINLTDPNGVIVAQKVLQRPLYYRSNPPIRRNIIDMPMFQQFVDRALEAKKFAVKPFFVQTFKEYFYKTRSDINYYIDMDQNELNAQLDLLTQIEDFDFLPAGVKLSNILGLFTSIYLEQRRTGFMFEWVKSTEDWTLSWRFPFLYDERNLNMPPEDQEAVQNNPFFSDSNFDEVLFARQHLIADRIGIGDLRINFEWLFVENHKQIFSAGIRATIPTAFAFKKGLYGTNFDVYAQPPAFDIYTDLMLPVLSTPPDQNIPLAQQNVQDLGNAIMDRLSTIVLQGPSGNNHHLAIGIFEHNEMVFSEKLSLSSIASLEVPFPATEQRFFIIYTPPAAFNAFDWEDTSVATGQLLNKLLFINQQFIDKFFPVGYETSVFPGFIIQSTSALTYHGRRLEVTVGTDLWFRTPERFLTIDAPVEIKKTVLRKDTAKTKFGYQSMFWFSIEKKVRPGSSWKLGLRGEATANSTGVGKDWGFCFLIQKQF